MLEKAIVALQLLGHLVEAQLPLQFKGGTSLLLRLPQLRRLSIDIDIATSANSAELLPILQSVSIMQPFVGFQHDGERDAALPPKQHFKFFYDSVIEPRRDQVLLDVLFEPEFISHATPVRIVTAFIDPIRPIEVSIPSIDALLGDKLTAFAPTTIGIPYLDRIGQPRKTDIVKQLFDVAVLFEVANDLNVIAEVYAAVHARQCAYRETAYTVNQTLDDSITAALQLSQLDLRGSINTENGLLLKGGVTALANHLVNHPFTHMEARVAAGKVACIATLIKFQSPLRLESLRYNPATNHELKDKTIGHPWEPLHRLKGGNPEAFHYWWHAWNLNK